MTEPSPNLPAETPPRDVNLARDMMSVEVILEQQRALGDLMKRLMVRGRHYGQIPGTQGDSLLKVGADVLCRAFRLACSYDVLESRRTGDEVSYVVSCTVTHQTTGVEVGSGLGSATTDEVRHQQTLAKRSTKYASIGPGELDNSVLKMAAKRAKVDAVSGATGCSELFASVLPNGGGPRRGARAPEYQQDAHVPDESVM